MTAGGLLIGGPKHGEIWALRERRQTIECLEPPAWSADDLVRAVDNPDVAIPAPRITLYHRRPCGGRYPTTALPVGPAPDVPAGIHVPAEVTVEWDVYVHDTAGELADHYLGLVHLLYLITGRLEPLSPVTATTLRRWTA